MTIKSPEYRAGFERAVMLLSVPMKRWTKAELAMHRSVMQLIRGKKRNPK